MVKEKNKNKLASQMYRGAKMGTQTIKQMIPKTTNQKLKEELIRQLELYNQIENKLYYALIDRNIKPKQINPLQSAGASITIFFDTLFSRTPSHIATLLIKGNNMGVIGITKILNQNTSKNDLLIDYGLEFINLIESNNEQLKTFL